MICDAIHSASDVLTTCIVIIGIQLSCKESDKEHPYGHERLECVAAIILSMILFITGLFIAIDVFESLLSGRFQYLPLPDSFALVGACVSIIVKEIMYWYTRYYALIFDSPSLKADAWHHRSDSLSSIGALVGILGSLMGYPMMDTLASFVIFIFIVKAAYDVFKDAINKMIDHSCDEDTQKKIYDHVMCHQDVLGIDRFQTRLFGNKIYVDIDIQVDANDTLLHAHSIAQNVHDSIENEFLQVKHIMIHVNPAKDE